MKISMIAAMDRNNAIGIDGGLPWHLPEDLKSFKALTTGKNMIMGSKTWDSFNNRALPRRGHLVITRYPEKYAECAGYDDLNIVTFHKGIKQALKRLEDINPEQEVMIIGGGEIYHQCIDLADTLYLSHVDTAVVKADAFFPVINRDVWAVNYSQTHPAGENNSLRWTYQVLNRIGGK